MTIEDKTVTFSYSPDGTEQVFQSIQPPAGEEWLIDRITVYCDGKGSNSIKYRLRHGGWESSISGSVSGAMVNNGVSGFYTGMYDNNVNANSKEINTYLNSKEKFLFGWDGSRTSTSSTFYYVVKIRRVL